MKWQSIDGEEYTEDEAKALVNAGLIEPCSHLECPQHYHRLEDFSDVDLIATLERLGNP